MRIRDGLQNFLGVWIGQVLRDKPFEVWGGEQLRDLTFVDDVTEAFLAAAQHLHATDEFSISAGPVELHCERLQIASSKFVAELRDTQSAISPTSVLGLISATTEQMIPPSRAPPAGRRPRNFSTASADRSIGFVSPRGIPLKDFHHGERVTVRQVDPGASYRAHKSEIDAAVMRVFGSGRFLLDAEVAGFETEFANWLGVRRAVGCANGTDALALLLRGLGVGPGCTVVTVSHTSIATVAAIEMVGGIPLLVDVEPDHYTMDVEDLAAVLENPPSALPSIRAVIVVHLYGQPADMSAIVDLCARYNLALLEDCCHAHGRPFKVAALVP